MRIQTFSERPPQEEIPTASEPTSNTPFPKTTPYKSHFPIPSPVKQKLSVSSLLHIFVLRFDGVCFTQGHWRIDSLMENEYQTN